MGPCGTRVARASRPLWRVPRLRDACAFLLPHPGFGSCDCGVVVGVEMIDAKPGDWEDGDLAAAMVTRFDEMLLLLLFYHFSPPFPPSSSKGPVLDFTALGIAGAQPHKWLLRREYLRR